MNYPRLFSAVLFYIQQNNYFGWNAKAGSDSELIADGITMLLFALCFVRTEK